MNFKPKKETELNSLLPKGEYEFKVIKAKEGKSNAGNDMITLVIDIYAPDGNSNRIYDYLLESVAYKLKHFCEAVGLSKEYEDGSLVDSMCVGRGGRCLIDIEIDKNGKYSDKNAVKDYIVSDILKVDVVNVVEDLPF